MYSGIGRSLGTDYFLIADQLTREELGYLRRTRDFVDGEVLPVINGFGARTEFPWPLVVVAGGALAAIAPELRIVHPVGAAGLPGLPGAGLLWICASRACARVAGDLTGAGS